MIMIHFGNPNEPTSIMEMLGFEHCSGDASRYMRSRDGMESVLIPGGQARIGDDTSCPSARENEGPSHMVELSTFLMDIEPVTGWRFQDMMLDSSA